MASVDRDLAVIFSKNKIVDDAGCLACDEAFSPVPKEGMKEWGSLMMRTLATLMIEDTDGQTLPAKDRQSVINYISGTL